MDDPAELRRVLRAHLAERPAVAQSAATIHRSIKREHPCTPEQAELELTVLVSLGQLVDSTDPLGGATRYYQISAQGILDHEAGR